MKYEIIQSASSLSDLLESTPDLGYQPSGKHIIPGAGIGAISAGVGLYKEALKQKSTQIALVSSTIVAVLYELYDSCAENAISSLSSAQNCKNGYLDGAATSYATLDVARDITTTVGVGGLTAFGIYKAINYIKEKKS